MKKAGAALLLMIVFSILFVSLVSGEENETSFTNIQDKSYACLEDKVKDKCNSLTYEEQTFALLALASDSSIQKECKDALKSTSSNGECWPSSGCTVKATAQALIALDNIGEDTKKIEDWILNQTMIPTGIDWFLEIDSISQTECTITYDGRDYKTVMQDNKKFNTNPGSCFSVGLGGYFLQIKSNCLEKKFIVSCDQEFISTLLYKEKGSDVIFVSSNVEAASAEGRTEHTINSLCFGTTRCEYGSSLWAVTALDQKGRDIDKFIPYLISNSEANKKAFPYPLLYFITGSSDYQAQVLAEQKNAGYWNIQNKYYDTALALLSVEGTNTEAESKAKEYLLDNVDADGCWGSIRDTSFLLWAGWPGSPPSTSSGQADIDYCEEYDYFCSGRGECSDAEGKVLDNYFCSGVRICCDKQPKELSCSEKSGEICPIDYECSISTVSASNTDECCLGFCEEETASSSEQRCEDYEELECKSSCSDDEEIVSYYDCDFNQLCCRPSTSSGGGGNSWIWILLLLILIVLVAIAIIKRDKIKEYVDKKRGKSNSTPKKGFGKPFPPGASSRMRTRPLQSSARPIPNPTRFSSSGASSPQRAAAPQRRIGTTRKTDKELDDTMRKLREI